MAYGFKSVLNDFRLELNYESICLLFGNMFKTEFIKLLQVINRIISCLLKALNSKN